MSSFSTSFHLRVSLVDLPNLDGTPTTRAFILIGAIWTTAFIQFYRGHLAPHENFWLSTSEHRQSIPSSFSLAMFTA